MKKQTTLYDKLTPKALDLLGLVKDTYPASYESIVKDLKEIEYYFQLLFCTVTSINLYMLGGGDIKESIIYNLFKK